MRTAGVPLQLSGHTHGVKAICITAVGDFSSKVPFLSKNYDSSEQIFFFFLMINNNFQEHFYLKLFSDRSITEYPKGVHLPWLYFYLGKTWEQRINACVSRSSEDNLYKCGTAIRKPVSPQGYRAHREWHPWRCFTNRALSHPSLERSPWIKIRVRFELPSPHPLRYIMIFHRNFVLLSPSSELDPGPIFKNFH